MTPEEKQRWVFGIKQIMHCPIPDFAKQQHIYRAMQNLEEGKCDNNSDAHAIILTDGTTPEFAGGNSLLCLAVTMQLPLIFDLFINKIGIGTVMCNDEIRYFFIDKMLDVPLFCDEELYQGYGPRGWRTPESMLPIQNPTWLNYLLSGQAKLELDPDFAEEAANALMPGIRKFLDSNQSAENQSEKSLYTQHVYYFKTLRF